MPAAKPSEMDLNKQTDSDVPLSVSVVIPCFNCMETIDRTIQSVLNQTKQPAEVILIDDGSSDGTLDRLHLLQAQYPDLIKVLQMPQN
jgi:glycosyltransferase involved in cell wall biosynthesis